MPEGLARDGAEIAHENRKVERHAHKPEAQAKEILNRERSIAGDFLRLRVRLVWASTIRRNFADMLRNGRVVS